MANCGLLLNDGSSFFLLNDGTSAILLNDASCAFEPGQEPTTTPTPDAGGVGGGAHRFPGVWTNRSGLPKKKKKKLDELDEIIAELRSRVEEAPAELFDEDAYQRQLRVSQALANQPNPSLQAIGDQIALLRAAIQEIDDEEAILLLAN